MKKTFLTTCMLRAALLLMTLLGSAQGAWAKDFISDVMVIGNNNETAFYNLQSSYEAQGWTAINKDLNAGCGSGTDFIHLLYKKQSSPGSKMFFIYEPAPDLCHLPFGVPAMKRRMRMDCNDL